MLPGFQTGTLGRIREIFHVAGGRAVNRIVRKSVGRAEQTLLARERRSQAQQAKRDATCAVPIRVCDVAPVACPTLFPAWQAIRVR